MPNPLTALLTHPFPASLLGQVRPQRRPFLLSAAAATTHGLNEPLQGRRRPRRPRGCAAAAATTASVTRSPPLPTDPREALLPVRLGPASHLNGTVPGSAELVLLPEYSRETKAAGEQGQEGGRGCVLSRAAALVLARASVPSVSGAPHLIMWHTRSVRTPHLKLCFVLEKALPKCHLASSF